MRATRFRTFVAAGLPESQMTAAGRVEGGAQSPVLEYVAEILRSLLLMTERTGVATAAEIDIDTVAKRLRKEAMDNDACIMLPPLVGAWTRSPAAARAETNGRRRRAVR